MKSIFAIILFLAVRASGFLFATDWDGLYSTWNIDPLKGFDKLPRQLSEIGQFVLKDDACQGNTFYGRRYWYKQDAALVLLFDVNGYIAGMQTSESKTLFTPPPGMLGFVDDGPFWTQTAYFVDPSIICTTGRTKSDFDSQGTGTGLWIQTGPNPQKDIINIPTLEADIKKTLWGHGKCFPSMGMHFWYNTSKDMSCNNIFPNCLLYNNNQLTAFCFTKTGYLNSPRYDYPHPTANDLHNFMDPVPDCFFQDPSFKNLTTMHVYFHSNPALTTLC